MRTHTKKEVNYQEVAIDNYKDICASCVNVDIVTNDGIFRKNPQYFCYKLMGAYVNSTATCDIFKRQG